MSPEDASPNEMPRFARQSGFSREDEELALDILLDGCSSPPEVPPELSALPRLLAELTGPASPSELAGERVVLSRFRYHLSPAGVSPAGSAGRRGVGRRLAAYRARLAAAAAVVGVALGGTAAAYAGALPGPVQEFAHHLIGAPAAGPSGYRPAGPGPLGRTRPGRSAGHPTARARHRLGRHPTRSSHPAKPTRPAHQGDPALPTGPGHHTGPGHGNLPPGHAKLPPGHQMVPAGHYGRGASPHGKAFGHQHGHRAETKR
jgi:hypothetical protein